MTRYPRRNHLQSAGPGLAGTVATRCARQRPRSPFRLSLALLAFTAAQPTPSVAAEDKSRHEDHAAASFSVADFEHAGVVLSTTGPGEVDLAFDLPGEVRPNPERISHIAPRYPGLVGEVRKSVGDTVKAGDVLAIIESSNLSTFELRAGIDGTVLDSHIVPGETVTPDTAAFIVADLSTVWVVVSVYQNVLSQVRVGQTVKVVASGSEAQAEGQISYLSPLLDQATRTANARVVLPNPDGAWRPGLFVSASVIDPVTVAIVIPRRAVQTLEQHPVVFVAEAGQFSPRAITLGRVGRTRVEVIDGLTAGERIADQRSFLVKAELSKADAPDEH